MTATEPDHIAAAIAQSDSATREFRIFGPPGTGKTTYTARQIARAVERFGPDAVMVTSFSRAAAAELAGRDLPIRPDRLGTLHAHCYRALGGPPIAEAHVEEWNRANPALHITPAARAHGRLDNEEGGAEEENYLNNKEGDALLAKLNRWRGMLAPPSLWPQDVRAFAQQWQAYKDELGLFDFTDLIEGALRDSSYAPGHPQVIFADEAQDLNPMQLALLREWGARTEYFILAGDDDQLIFSHLGCAPEGLIEPELPAGHVITLKQSWRIPRTVHTAATRWIEQVSRRQAKEYRPREEMGAVTRSTATCQSLDGLLKVLEHADAAGESVMLLATCGYMLQPVVAFLRQQHLTYHNPYRRSNGFWNPLASHRPGSVANRIAALLAAHPRDGARRWTRADLHLFAEWMGADAGLRRGVKTRLAEGDPAEDVSPQMLQATFTPEAIVSLLDAFEAEPAALVEWWRGRLTATHYKRAQFAADVAAVRGAEALTRRPSIVVGTVHSVKGGEADTVVLFPDLSRAGSADWMAKGPPRDSVIRTMYVGMTRARRQLLLAERATPMGVAWGNGGAT